MRDQSNSSASTFMVIANLMAAIRIVMIKAAVLAETAAHPGADRFGAAECWLVISGVSFLLTFGNSVGRSEVRRQCLKALEVPGHRQLLMFRGAAGAGADVLLLFSSLLIPMAVSTLLLSSHVFFLLLFSWLILKENASVFSVVCALMGYLGISLAFYGQMNSGLPDALAPAGVLAGLLAGVATSFSLLAVRRGRHLPAPLHMMALQLCNVLISVGLLAWKGIHLPTAPLAMVLLCLSFLPEVGFEVFKILALQKAPASALASSAFSRPIFSGMLGLIFFGEHLSSTAQAGMAIVIVFGLLLPVIQVRRQQPAPLLASQGD